MKTAKKGTKSDAATSAVKGKIARAKSDSAVRDGAQKESAKMERKTRFKHVHSISTSSFSSCFSSSDSGRESDSYPRPPFKHVSSVASDGSLRESRLSEFTDSLPPVPDDSEVIDVFVDFLKGLGVRVVVLDMDKTLTSQHSGGAINQGEPLNEFVNSVTPVARQLILALIKSEFQLAVATFSDDLYTLGPAGGPPKNVVAGTDLVCTVLGSILTEDQIRRIPIVTLNPGLYQATTQQAQARHARLEAFYREKLETLFTAHEETGRLNRERERERLKKSSDGKQAGGSLSYIQPFDPKALAAQFRYPPPPFKDLHMQLLAELYQCEPRTMCLIDDTIENVQNARANNYVGVEVRSAPSGLDAGDLALFMDMQKRKETKLPFAC